MQPPIDKNLTQFLQWPRWQQFLLLAAGGALAGLGQAPTDFYLLSVLLFAVLLCLSRCITSPRQGAFVLWCCGFGYFACSLRWIVEPFLVDIARHGWMAPFAMALMAAGGGLFWALAGWLAARLAPGRMLVLALLLVGAEVLRSLILTGFPWALIGHIWISTHFAQIGAFGGPHLLSLLTVVTGLCIAAVLRRQFVTGIAGLAILFAAAFALRPDPPAQVAPEQPIVRLVQPNAPQHQKWDPAFRDVFLNRMIALTGQGDVPDLVVWPETSVPYLLGQIEDDLVILTGAARGAPLVFGIQRRDADRRAYNSLVVTDAGGQISALYDKRHLVPFGEYIPGARMLGQFGLSGMAGNLGTGFTTGTGSSIVNVPGIGPALAMICYEGIFAEEISYDTRPRFLLLITNDAWFGAAAGPRQHLAQARLRAIEHGLPMVRVANTGISAVFDGKGRTMGALDLNVEGAIDVALPPALPPTLYARTGDLPVILLWFLFTVAAIAWHRRDSD